MEGAHATVRVGFVTPGEAIDLTRSSALQTAAIVTRLVAAIGGGYAVTAGVAALAAVALPMLTAMPRSEAVVLVSMLAFVLYLVLLIWAFAARRLGRLCAILLAAGATSWGGALALARLSTGG
jgi:hypothetical protein